MTQKNSRTRGIGEISDQIVLVKADALKAQFFNGLFSNPPKETWVS